MNHFGILCPAGIGHLNPMCALGNELQRRGHRVTLFGVPDIREKIVSNGIEFYEIGAQDFPPNSLELMSAQMGKLSGLKGLKFGVEAGRKGTLMLFREAPAAIRQAGVNLLIVDQATASGGTIADYLNLPFVTICNTLPFNQEPGVPPTFTHWGYRNIWWAKLRNQVAYQFFNYLTYPIWKVVIKQRQHWKLSHYHDCEDSYSPLAQICQIPKALDFPRARLPSCFHYAGLFRKPLKDEVVSFGNENFSFNWRNEKPLIYANLGTLQNRNWNIFNYIAEACLDIEAQLVISLGNPRADSSSMNFPGAPIVFAFPPHQELINQASLVITHAGSTALNCLSAGVPMVAIPITMDQPGMAARIKHLGASEVITLKQLNHGSALKTAINRVLQLPNYRESAGKMSKILKASGGVRYAADVIEQVSNTRSPVGKI